MKNVAIVLLISLGVLLVPTPVAAENWILFRSIPAQNMYYDADSISDGPNGTKEVKTKWLKEMPLQSGNKYIREDSPLQRFYPNKTYCNLSTTQFYTDGTVMKHTNLCRIQQISVAWETLWNILFE